MDVSELIAAIIAVVSSVTPLPLAPKSRTLKLSASLGATVIVPYPSQYPNQLGALTQYPSVALLGTPLLLHPTAQE